MRADPATGEPACFPSTATRFTALKTHDAHFARLFHRHNSLDQEIHNMEAGLVPASTFEIERLKKEKLLLKDQLYQILRRTTA
ncbi:conserved hypothetical protein, DUF465 [Cupriavidus taiwanensis]|nr:conserved hypothetical protein, DUF465 [Cupriavidus taiwanensis]SOZ76475.1 conserved hypothetical protein, DUF465 [Cupriavidus taiwanensis]SOZ80777.1 conserved hypothetical protein, DUF465 [Cupriavidus taiwanensis]SOZ85170.1 conserved hypothetical protein, DUF465 [Cupriavidus taiwanensis]